MSEAVAKVRAESLVRHYRTARASVCAVDGISFSVRRRETLGVVGESGSGKSTLARLLVRLDEPSAGRLTVDGTDILALRGRHLRRWRRNAQIVLQDPYNSLSPRMRVIDQIIEAWRVHPGICPPHERHDRALALLGAVGLSSAHAQRLPRELSGGQRQRVSIARALAVEPTFLVCDEPVSALDVSIQAQILNIVRDVSDRLGLATVFISHDLAVVRYISDRVAVMYLGKIVEIGETEQVYLRPRHPYTVALHAAEPRPPGEKTGGKRVVLATGELPSPSNIPSGCRFHTRCWKAREICRAVEPPLAGNEFDHAAACHFPENVDADQEQEPKAHDQAQQAV